jgi:hypothetical protein
MILPLTREIFCKNIQALLVVLHYTDPHLEEHEGARVTVAVPPINRFPHPISFASDLTQHHGRLQANLRNILYLYKLEHTSTQQSVVKLS